MRVLLVHLVNVKHCQVASVLKPSQLTWATSPPVSCYRLHAPVPFIIIIIISQPESWYSLYHILEGRWLS